MGLKGRLFQASEDMFRMCPYDQWAAVRFEVHNKSEAGQKSRLRCALAQAVADCIDLSVCEVDRGKFMTHCSLQLGRGHEAPTPRGLGQRVGAT